MKRCQVDYFQDVNKILDRIKLLFSLVSDAELAEFMDVSPPTVSNWRTRGSVPYEKIIAKCEGKSLDLIFKGEEPPPMVAEECDPYIASVATMMRSMDDDTKKDIQLSVEKEKLLRDLLKDKQRKEAV